METVFAIAVDLGLFKGALLVLAAAAACSGLRRRAASVRHAVWVVTFIALLGMPVLHLAAPASNLTLVGVQASVASGPIHAPALPVAVAPQARGPAVVLNVPGHRTRSWLVVLWLSGVAFQFVRLAGQFVALRGLRLRASPAPPAISERLTDAAARLRITTPVRVITSDEVSTPCTFGLFRPVIVLPDPHVNCTAEQLDVALIHELFHVRHRDFATQTVARIVVGLYWMNPFVWYAARRLAVERERACDDRVVTSGGYATTYAECLVRFAALARRPTGTPAMFFARGSSLPERIAGLLDPSLPRAPIRTRMLLLLIVTAAGLVAVVTRFEVAGSMPAFAVPPAAEPARVPDPRHELWAMGESEDPAYVPELIDRLADPDERVRSVAAWALGEIKDPQAMEPLENLLADPNQRVREMAVLAIGELVEEMLPRSTAAGEKDRERDEALRAEDAPLYMRQLTARTPEARARAAINLGVLGDEAAVDPLLDALQDADPDVRAAAVWALDEINPSRKPRPAQP